MAANVAIQSLSSRPNWPLIEKTHNKILKTFKNAKPLIFPIYIKYIVGDEVVAILYYRGSSSQSNSANSIQLQSNEVDVGFNVPKLPSKRYRDAAYMRDKNINYSVKINSEADIKEVDSGLKLVNI